MSPFFRFHASPLAFFKVESWEMRVERIHPAQGWTQGKYFFAVTCHVSQRKLRVESLEFREAIRKVSAVVNQP